MNEDAKRIIDEKAGREYIKELLKAMVQIHEQLEYLIEILE